MSYTSVSKMVLLLKQIVPILNKHMDKNKTILIHCRAGAQRSATVMASLFMYRYKLTKWRAIQLIRSHRLVAFLPMPNFIQSLDIYENYLNINSHYN